MHVCSISTFELCSKMSNPAHGSGSRCILCRSGCLALGAPNPKKRGCLKVKHEAPNLRLFRLDKSLCIDTQMSFLETKPTFYVGRQLIHQADIGLAEVVMFMYVHVYMYREAWYNNYKGSVRCAIYIYIYFFFSK